MNTSNLSESAKPIVVRGAEVLALAERLEAGTHTEHDLRLAARLARHAASVWIGGFAAVSLR